MKLAIIILHFGNIENTKQCIASVTCSDFPKNKLKIHIVNNDKNIRLTSQHISLPSYAEIINNKKNLGFAGGINTGIRKVMEDRNITDILLLNNDTLIEKNTLQTLTDEKAAITSPVIKFNYLSEWKYDYGGKINWLIGRPFHMELTTNNIQLAANIDYVSGCCMRVKREVFDSIGYLDENFFFYFEDVDFCVRAKKAGFDITVASAACITHTLSASIGKWSSRAIYYNITSNAKFIQKHLGLRRPIGFIYLMLLTIKIVTNKIT